jgi:hypothetical protein
MPKMKELRMKKQHYILIPVLMILFCATPAFAAEPQRELPPEKKKELRSFDPVDIAPPERSGGASRESEGNRNDRRGRQARDRSDLAPDPTLAEFGVQSGAASVQPTPAAAAASAVTTESPIQSAPPATGAPPPPAPAAATAPGLEETISPPARGSGFPVSITFVIIGLVSITLIVVIMVLIREVRRI